MAKRRQTTGVPSKKRQQSVEQPVENKSFFDNLLGNPTNRAEREEAINRLITRSTIVVGVVVVLLIVTALLVDQVIVPNQTVAQVNDQTITVGEFRERVEFERARLLQELNSISLRAQSIGIDPNQIFSQEPYATWINEVNFPDQLGRRVLDDMIDDILVAQQAEELNISIEQDSVQSEINSYFNYDPTAIAQRGLEPTTTPTPTITPTPFVSPTPSPTATITPMPTEAAAESTAEATAEVTATLFATLAPSPTPSAEDLQNDFEDTVNEFRRFIRVEGGVNNDVIDAYFERLALRDAVSEAVVGDLNTALYVNARHILVETQEQAQEVLDALQAGESFSALARSLSTDTGSGQNGGNLGWAPVDNYVPEFADAVRTAEIGEIVGPVQSDFGYHIIQVRGREDREVTDFELQQARAEAFDEWLTGIRESNAEDIQIADNWTDYVPR